MLKFNRRNKTMPQFYYNIGALMDIPTANFIKGRRGETIINGGLGPATAIVGAGNNYKSTILHYMMLSASDKIFATAETAMETYDTEVNIGLDRLESLASNFKYIPEYPITGNGAWSIVDKSIVMANVWEKELGTYIDEKSKNKKLIKEFTAFVNPYNKEENIKQSLPTFVEIDSLTEFESEATSNMLDKDLDDSSTNTFAMKQSLFKSKFLSKVPRLSSKGNVFFLMTAHIGEKINMDTSPMAKYNQPTKKLQYLKTTDAIKGTSGKFFFLLNQAWMAHTASILKNQSTKLAEYPLSSDDSNGVELNNVKMTLLRNKNGQSGITVDLVVSQVDGVLPTLTEFHYIKSNNRFGIEGSNTHYNIVFLPDVKLSRTTVRRKINENDKLKRAINIASELLQLQTYHPRFEMQGLMCSPETLYKDLKVMGYDWDELLDTRGWWTIDQYSDKIKPFLSTVDLLKMRKGLYKPYWIKEKK
jgi:hypothetical protein